MKILTIVWSVGIGGTERAAVNYAIGYKLFSCDSKVLVLGEGYERLTDLKEAGVDTYLLNVQTCSLKEIKEAFNGWTPDIIHIHNFNISLLPYIELFKGKATKVVETSVFSRPVMDVGYKVVDMSMQLSKWGYWKYSHWIKCSNYKPQLAVVPYIVDSHKFKEPSRMEVAAYLDSLKIPGNAFVVGRIGQPHPSKWDMRLLSVIKATLKGNNNIYYLLVGAPRNLINEINQQSHFFKSRVKLIDSIHGDANLSLFYHSLSCFAHISKIGESFGYVLTEAMLCKVPVVTMLTPLKDNAQFEVVGHNAGGICVTDTSEFIEGIIKLYEDVNFRHRLKLNLQNWVQERYSYEKVVPAQLGNYKLLIDGHIIPEVGVDDVVKNALKQYGWSKYFYRILLNCMHHGIFFRILNGRKIKFG